MAGFSPQALAVAPTPWPNSLRYLMNNETVNKGFINHYSGLVWGVAGGPNLAWLVFVGVFPVFLLGLVLSISHPLGCPCQERKAVDTNNEWL